MLKLTFTIIIEINFLGSWNSKVEHYRVRYTPNNKLTVDDDTFFENLTKLVEVGDVMNKINTCSSAEY